MKPTQKQLAFISDIQEFVDKSFTGTTKEEATLYISENIEMYNVASSFVVPVNGLSTNS